MPCPLGAGSLPGLPTAGGVSPSPSPRPRPAAGGSCGRGEAAEGAAPPPAPPHGANGPAAARPAPSRPPSPSQSGRPLAVTSRSGGGGLKAARAPWTAPGRRSRGRGSPGAPPTRRSSPRRRSQVRARAGAAAAGAGVAGARFGSELMAARGHLGSWVPVCGARLVSVAAGLRARLNCSGRGLVLWGSC